jgi:hypothetical protein
MQLARLANNVAFMARILALTAWTGHSASHLGRLVPHRHDGSLRSLRSWPGYLFAGIHPHLLAHRLGRFADRALSVRAFFRPLDFIIWHSLFHFADLKRAGFTLSKHLEH